MTEAQFKKLKKYEENFTSAVYADYSRNMMRSDLEKIKTVYDEITGNDYQMNYSCGSCQLRLLQLVGRKYFEYKSEKKEKKESKEDGKDI